MSNQKRWIGDGETPYSITLVPPAVTTDEPYEAIVFATDRADMWERIQAVLDGDESVAPGMWSGWCIEVNGPVAVMGA